ncbi:hypothetical protein ACLOJK_026747 [Asimina triloba]
MASTDSHLLRARPNNSAAPLICSRSASHQRTAVGSHPIIRTDPSRAAMVVRSPVDPATTAQRDPDPVAHRSRTAPFDLGHRPQHRSPSFSDPIRSSVQQKPWNPTNLKPKFQQRHLQISHDQPPPTKRTTAVGFAFRATAACPGRP